MSASPDENAALEKRLRAALADSHERAPRPLAKLDLPIAVQRKLMPVALRELKPAAVLAPVLQRADGPHMLLTRRADHLKSHKGQVSFPGGRRDAADQSAAANALREAREEVGLAPHHVDVLGYLDDYPTGTGYRVTPVVGLVRGQPQLTADPGEVAEVFEVPMSLILNPASYRRAFFVSEGLRLPYFELNYAEQRIWGATAWMLRDLCLKLQAHED